jgi:hypothetical protein
MSMISDLTSGGQISATFRNIIGVVVSPCLRSFYELPPELD